MGERRIVVGFRIEALCFPPWEWGNWHWSREVSNQMFAVGPMRFDFGILRANRGCADGEPSPERKEG